MKNIMRFSLKKTVTVFLILCICFLFGIVFSACDFEFLEPEHIHEFQSEWQYDDACHWHVCKSCTEISEESEHIFEEGICSVCEFRTESTDNGYLEHNCSFDTEWTQDGTRHWHTCLDENCDLTEDSGEHNFVDGICSVCDFDIATALELTLSEDGTYYSVTNRNFAVAPWEVFIPPVYKGIPITHIISVGNMASISIPDSIVYIEEGAIMPLAAYGSGELKYLGNENNPYIYLYGNNSSDIETAEIKDGCKIINRGVFYGCSNLKSVSIPDTVISIGSSVFEGCSNLESITIPNGVTSIGYYAFYECSSLTNIVLPDSVVSVGTGAFYGCVNLKEVTLSKRLNTISSQMFWRCESLTEISLDYVTTIYSNAFSDCVNLENIWLSDDITYVSNFLTFKNCKNLKYNEKDGNKYLGSKTNKYLYLAYADTANTSTISIENGCKYIGGDAFSGRDMTEVKIPETVKVIGSYAFNYCTELEHITIPDSVTFIDEYAFNHCAIKSIEIPSSVTSISNGTFWECLKLEEVKLPDTLTSIGNSAFSGCGNLKHINIPSGVTSISAGTFGDCKNLEELKLPDTLKSIGDFTFEGCTNLKRINIPNSVTSFGDFMFYGCESLVCNEKDGLKYLGNDDNKYLYLLGSISNDIESVNIDSGCKCIGSYAYKECNDITTVVIPNNIVKVDSFAFSNCENLESVIISDCVNSIGWMAFAECVNLKTVIIGSGVSYVDRLICSGSNDVKIYCKETSASDTWDFDWRQQNVFWYSEEEPSEEQLVYSENHYWHYDIDGKTIIEWN